LGMCWQQVTPHHRHCIQEVNVVIKMLCVKDNFCNKFALKDSIFFILFKLKNRQVFLPDPVHFCRTLYVSAGPCTFLPDPVHFCRTLYISAGPCTCSLKIAESCSINIQEKDVSHEIQ
jgi:hypothetical protein